MLFLNKRVISAAYHYTPLHKTQAGFRFRKFYGDDTYTLMESSRLLRLPLYYELKESDVDMVCETIYKFYS